jgi:glutathione S-transferase
MSSGNFHLYIANKNYSSWSFRAWLLLKHFSIPFEEHQRTYQGGHGGRQPQWKEFSPVAHVPCLHHFPSSSSSSPTSADASPSPTAVTPQDPIVVWESLSIVDYIADLHPDLPIWPLLSEKRGLERRAWARSAAAEMHAGFAALRDEMNFNVGLRVEFKLSDAAKRQFERLDELWTEGLTRFGGPFLAGAEFGAVDAFFAPVVLRCQTFVGSMEALGEASRAYATRMLELEGVREWVDAALREPLRHGDGEKGTLMGRRMIEDLRRTEEEIVTIHY